MGKTTELRAKRAKLIEDARDLSESCNFNAEAAAKFDAMMAEADGLKAKIDRIERVDEAEREAMEGHRNARMGLQSGAQSSRGETAAHDAAFSAWLRGGVMGLNDTQQEIYRNAVSAPLQATAGASGGWTLTPRAAQGVGSDPAGGYTVPQGFYGQLVSAQLAYGGMLSVANVIDTGTGRTIPMPTDNDTTNEGALLGENIQVSTQDLTFGQVLLGAYTYTSNLILISNQLLQDTAFDLEGHLAKTLGVRIARAINDDFTIGTGAAQPSGVVGPAANSAPLGYTAGGSPTSGSVASVSYDDLVELEHSVNPAYRGPKCRFMFHDTTLRAIKSLKDGIGRPLWLPGLADGAPDTILGHEYVTNPSMPLLGAGAKCAAFGDFSNYYIRRVAGVQILRLTERYADLNQVGFLAFQRWDGTLVDAGTHPITYLQNAAS